MCFKRWIKRGEITTQQIVILIILIVSFAVILYFLYQLNPGGTGAEEICHNSVVMSKYKVLDSGGLDCKTQYLCISGGGGCKDFSSTETVKVNLDEADISKKLYEKMSNCWWMYGESQVDFVSAFSFPGNYPCSICYIVNFDEEIKSKFSNGIGLEDPKTPINFGVFSPGMSSIDPNKKFVILATLNFDVVAQRLAEKTGEFNKYPKIIYNTGSNPLAVFLKEDEKQSFSQVSCKEIISKA